MARSLFVFLVVLCWGVGVAQAQRITDFERSRYAPAAYYNYSEPGDVTMLVNVWGSVRNPGLYEIPQGTRLSTLLSLAGGPDLAINASVRANRTIIMRLLRDEQGQRRPIFETTMRNEVLVSDEDPVLVGNDVLTIETKLQQKISWRDVFPIVAALGTVALAIERISSR